MQPVTRRACDAESIVMSETYSLNVVCLATFFKGVEFIRELKSHGCRVVVVTKERFLQEDWPRDSMVSASCISTASST